MAEQGRRSSRFGLIFAVILLLGLGLRLFSLNGESVSYDESFSMAACRMPTGDMLRLLVADFVHPPLHYGVLCGWLDVAGFGVLQARLLSVIFGTLSIVVLYLLADYLFDRRTALISSLLLAVSQLEIMFSQDARMYSQFLFLFLCCCYVFIRAQHERSFRLWCGFIVLSALLIYTHYYGMLVLGALVVFAFLYRRQLSVPLSWWAGGAAAVTLAYLPWLTSGVVQTATHSGKTFSGAHSWWSVHWYTFVTAVNFFNNGKPAGLLRSAPLWTYPIGAALFSIPAVLAFFFSPERRDRQHFWLAAMLWILPILGALAGGLMNLQYDVRYVAFCAAPYYILVGRGIAAIPRPFLRACLIVLLLGYTANSLRANYFIPRREDFRGAATYVQQHRRPGDCAVFLPKFRAPLQWNIEHPDGDSLRTLDASDYAERASSCDRIWTISGYSGGNPLHVTQAKAEQARLEASHTRIDQQHYTWVDVALFSRKPPQ
jgi:mannosyltransferase